MSVQALKARCKEYYEKVLAIAKRRSEMSSDDLAISLEYAFRRHELLQAEREELDFHIGFAAFVVADIERQQAGHSESAAIFKLCKCEWCINGWTPEKGRG